MQQSSTGQTEGTLWLVEMAHAFGAAIMSNHVGTVADPCPCHAIITGFSPAARFKNRFVGTFR